MIEVDITARLGAFGLEAAFSVTETTTALFGPSGCGKTSLVRAIAGLQRPRAGHIRVNGVPLFDAARGIDLPPEKRGIGYVFQESLLFPHLDVRANLLYGRRRGRAAPFGLAEVVRLLELEPLLDRRPERLSGGERQRVAIGRALLAATRLLLLDEPLSSLDARRKQEILPFLERVRDDLRIPAIYVSHAMDEVLRLADAMVVMDQGRVVRAGRVEDVVNQLEPPAAGSWRRGGAVLRAVVAGHHREWGLTGLRVGSQELSVPAIGSPPGSWLRVRIRARDVILCMGDPGPVSTRNRLRGSILSIRPPEGQGPDGPEMDVLLDVEGGRLRARVTRQSVADLALRPGLSVLALIKAAAVEPGAPAKEHADRTGPAPVPGKG